MSLFDPYVPEDFDEFWAEAVEEAKRTPLNYRRSPQSIHGPTDHLVELISFQGVTGETLHGWIAVPFESKRSPGFLWIAPYGRESKLPDRYGLRKGFVSLSFNFHGESAFHQEEYVPVRGYLAQGAEDPETWIFRTMLQNTFIAARVLEAQLEVDEDRIAAMGMSQGGGLAIWIGALFPGIKAVCSDMPFMCAMRETMSRSIWRYPLKELVDLADEIPIGHERVLNTLAYYDTVNFATRCRVPTQVSLGKLDPASRPANVKAAFDALPGKKHLIEYDWGHDWGEPMVDNNRTWLLENL